MLSKGGAKAQQRTEGRERAQGARELSWRTRAWALVPPWWRTSTVCNSSPWAPDMHMVPRHACRQNSHTHKLNTMKIKKEENGLVLWHLLLSAPQSNTHMKVHSCLSPHTHLANSPTNLSPSSKAYQKKCQNLYVFLGRLIEPVAVASYVPRRLK